MNEIVTNILINLVTMPVSFVFGWFRGKLKARSTVWPVEIKTVEITDDASRIEPEILVATFSGMDRPKDMDEATFQDALLRADLEMLPINGKTKSIGVTIQLIETYPSLKKIFLVTTRSKEGRASDKSAPLLAKYCSERLGRAVEIVADRPYAIDVDKDQQVIQASFAAVRNVFEAMKRDPMGYRPKESRIIVDVTGGTKSMSIGAILACLRPDQDIHLIASPYDEAGEPLAPFPLLVKYKMSLSA